MKRYKMKTKLNLEEEKKTSMSMNIYVDYYKKTDPNRTGPDQTR